MSHVYEAKKLLPKDVHRLARLGVRFEDPSNGCFMVHDNSKSSLVGDVKSKQHLDHSLIELKESVLGKNNEPFYLGGNGVLRYKGRLCVSNVDVLRN